MASGKACGMVCCRAMCSSFCQTDGVSVEWRVPKEVGMLLVEGDGAFGPVDAQTQRVSLAGRDLTRDEVASCTGVVEERGLHVVVDPTTGDHEGDICRQLIGKHASHKARQMI